jgi:RNA polymerase sigma factor (sigma-70 family)
MVQAKNPTSRWSTERLVDACLAGDSLAWGALVDKYKNLTYAVVVRYGVPEPDAADLFQSVWLDAYNDLANLRNKEAFKSWLITLTRRKCYHWRQRQRQQALHERNEMEDEDLEAQASFEPTILAELERDQLVREAVLRLPARCAEMIDMLFFQQPPLPYQEVADRLGLAVGSIGFIRGRCLKKLQQALESLGVEG